MLEGLNPRIRNLQSPWMAEGPSARISDQAILRSSGASWLAPGRNTVRNCAVPRYLICVLCWVYGNFMFV